MNSYTEPKDFIINLSPSTWPTLPPGSHIVVSRRPDRPGFLATIPSIGVDIDLTETNVRSAMQELADKLRAIVEYRLSRLYRNAVAAMRPGRHDRGCPKVAA